MACPNCNKFLHLCKAGCCGVFPLEKSLLYAHRDKIHTPITNEIDMGDDTVVPMTKSGNCTFLKADLSCSIYEYRPEVCNLFGNEQHLNLTCSYQTKDGQERSYFSKNRIKKEQDKKVKKILSFNK